MGYLLDLAKTAKKTPVRLSSLCYEKNEFNEISSPSVFIPNQTPPKIVESGGVIWRNPYPQGTQEARQETLREVMLAMRESAGSHMADLDNIHVFVLAGKAQLADYRGAVEGLTQRRSTHHE